VTAQGSVVQLGDSIASGEGTLYGYTYDRSTQTWTGGNVNVTWPGPYPLCHDSPDAYGELVAAHLKAKLTQFACTGAAFDDGITVPRVNKGYFSDTTLRPAEFGDWDARTDLNAAYDAAKPDVTLVTLGADDVQFSAIVEACIENAYEYAIGVASEECVPANPGSTVTSDFTGYLPTFVTDEKTLADWIVARGKADGRVPKVVFTDYADPLPQGTSCPDSNDLYPEQVAYLDTLLHEMNTTIISTIDGLKDNNLAVADISGVYAGHRWCSTDPWAYGLSIYSVEHPTSFESLAPFHPTPAGQAAIAAAVDPVVEKLLAKR